MEDGEGRSQTARSSPHPLNSLTPFACTHQGDCCLGTTHKYPLLLYSRQMGVIGMVGNNDVEEQLFSHGSWRWGKVIACTGTTQLLLNPGEIAEEYREVDCLDGMARN